MKTVVVLCHLCGGSGLLERAVPPLPVRYIGDETPRYVPMPTELVDCPHCVEGYEVAKDVSE